LHKLEHLPPLTQQQQQQQQQQTIQQPFMPDAAATRPISGFGDWLRIC